MLKDLTYKVIVMDDDTDLYDDYTEFIREYLSSEGYLLEADRYEELEELDTIDLDSVDLFLVDLKFGKEDKGPEFIKKIREETLTDILFYSSDAKAIQNNRNSGEYEGLFFAVRDENKDTILPTIRRLLDKMIKRSNTPLSSRGIVLGCVAELDNVIKRKIETMTVDLSDEMRKSLVDICVKQFYSSYRGRSNKFREFFGCEFHNGMTTWEQVQKAYTCNNVYEMACNPAITDSNRNLNILLEIYKKQYGKDEVYTSIKDFPNLLDIRNIFAHVQEEKNADGVYQLKRLKSGEYLILSEEQCRELRKKIIEYAEHFDRIKTNS